MRGGARTPILIGLALVMVMGIAVYFRLWLIDYRISSDEAELLRRQFDLANREAIEESADWRLRYDDEVERASKCTEELTECLVQQALVQNDEFFVSGEVQLLSPIELLNFMPKSRLVLALF
ncbi:hypothetical protein Acr_22g0008020 [Actinidia rufa]|uniref:Uncharacterized protein n=1 Tax=Actinidia rufa TaxID=165716 RepID=A0A7J0GL18_9ERIC|nr:hypothetical protein Acr_22g0008020 [Actinidia rufa]